MNAVRELEPGERPREWGLDEEDSVSRAELPIAAPARVDGERRDELESPQRYKVQFTATEDR